MHSIKAGIGRRDFNKRLLTSIVGLTFASNTSTSLQAQTGRSLRIGVVGSGNLGGAIGKLLAAAGHQILFSSRNPGELGDLVAEAGPLTQAGYPAEAAEFGEVIFLAVPYSAIPQLGIDLGPLLQGKVVLDGCNPQLSRDGEMATIALEKGSGVATAEYFPGARVVRAFGTIYYRFALESAHREGEKIAMPIAGDDAEAVAVASNLVIDAGFDPVVVGRLATSKQFDMGTPASGADTTAVKLREMLNL